MTFCELKPSTCIFKKSNKILLFEQHLTPISLNNLPRSIQLTISLRSCWLSRTLDQCCLGAVARILKEARWFECTLQYFQVKSHIIGKFGRLSHFACHRRCWLIVRATETTENCKVCKDWNFESGLEKKF